MSKLKLLANARDEQRAAHAAKCRKLFEDHPELFEEAIVVDPASGQTLAPEWMEAENVVGVLSAAIWGIHFATFMQSQEES